MERNPENKLKLGLFGGTFDPVHYGHISTVKEIHNRFNLTKTIFIPAHIPHHKKKPVTESVHRLEMVKLSVLGFDYFEVLDAEIIHDGNSYSFQTIEYFKKSYKNKVDPFFILGIDVFLEISTWKNYPNFFSESNFIVMNRPGYTSIKPEDILPADIATEFDYDHENKSFKHKSGYCIHYVNVTPHDISSTDIRAKIKEGRETTGLISNKVSEYIKNNCLYS